MNFASPFGHFDHSRLRTMLPLLRGITGICAALAFVSLRVHAQTPVVVTAALSPARHANTATPTATINLQFDQNMDGSSFTASSLFVHGNMRGKRVNGAYTTGVNTVNFPATPARFPNEIVSVTVTNATSTLAVANRPFVYQFRTGVTTGPGLNPAEFQRSQITHTVTTFPRDAATADVDNDGDVDIIEMSGSGVMNGTIQILTNDGTGIFTVGANIPIGVNPRRLVVGDIDNDGDVDIIVANADATVSVIRNGTIGAPGAFAIVSTVMAVAGASSMQTLEIADVNADGNA